MSLSAIYHTPKSYNNLTMKKYFIFIHGRKNLISGGGSIDSGSDYVAAAAMPDRKQLCLFATRSFRQHHGGYDCTE